MARQRGNRWQADVEYQGRRRRFSFGTREEAEAWEEAVRRADRDGLPLPPTSNPRSTSALTLGDFAWTHFDYLWGGTKSASNMKFQVRVVLRDLGEDTPISSITSGTLVEMVSRMKREGLANSTINRKLSCLSVLFKLAHQLGVVNMLPTVRRLREPQGRTRFLTRDEERELTDYLLHIGLVETYHLVRFLLYTGCRRGEALGLTWRDVDLHEGTVTFWITKADQPRTLRLVGPARDALEWAKGRDRFDEGGERPFTIPADTFRKHWDRAREALGFSDDPQYVPHMLRHTCASRLVQAGVDLRRVQVWMGHKNIQTTLRYAHLAPTDLDRAAQALMDVAA